MGKVFISYRRGADSAFAGRLFERLKRPIGHKSLFMDVDSIAPGQEFLSFIEVQISECEVLLAIIGRGWVTAADLAGGRRLDKAGDFVRIEIATALSHGKHVIPILVDDTPMPTAEELSEDLRPLAGRSAIRVNNDRFTVDSGLLIRSIKRILADDEAMRAARQLVRSRINPPEMIKVGGGQFMMGSNELEIEKPIRNVALDDFEISKHLITFSRYDAYCEDQGYTKPFDEGWGRETRPVINVSWIDAVNFCNWLSKIHDLDFVYLVNGNSIIISNNNGFRLPTEAEWEYAARGGKKSKEYRFAGSNILNQVAWSGNNAGQQTHPIGELNSNELGIHDMSGNVWEWCADICHDDYRGAPSNGEAWLTGGNQKSRIVRGGYWGSADIDCRACARCDWIENESDYDLGFRVARTRSDFRS